MIEWVSVEVIIDLHGELLEEHGGAAGLRDRGLLESALARPRQRLHDDPEADPFALAALYAAGIGLNHPFVDGNKRAAFVAAGTFLGLNGWHLDATETEAERSVVALVNREISEDAFAGWLRSRSIRDEAPDDGP